VVEVKYVFVVMSRKSPFPELVGLSHNHGIGIRSHLILLPVSTCAARFSLKIAEMNSHFNLLYPVSCDSLSETQDLKNRILPKLVSHPNVSGALLVGSGCELTPAEEFLAELITFNSCLEYLDLSDSPNEEFALLLGASTLNEISMRALPGLDLISNPRVGVICSDKSLEIETLITAIRREGIEVIVGDTQFGLSQQLWELTENGVLSVIALPSAFETPISMPIIPVINVSSGSEIHLKLNYLFDLHWGEGISAVIERLKLVLSRSLTKTEAFKFSQVVGIQK